MTNHPIPNTLQIDAKAKYFAVVKSVEDLREVLSDTKYQSLPHHILGTGSNTLFTRDYPGLIIHMQIFGKEVIEETDQHIRIKLSAGEDWPSFVTYAVDKGWGGVENLARIPGTLGAAPVQNIAAYGQNFEDVFHSLEAMQIDTQQLRTFSNADCQFGYRDSYFKQEGKGKYIITSVTLQLNKQHQLETNYFSMGSKYESIQKELQSIAQQPYTIKDVYQSVTNIRTRQLPDWTKTPTAGSFFKNPIITQQQLQQLQKQIPELQIYPADQLSYRQINDAQFNQSEYVKVPAGRLLDYLGWKGKVQGNVTTFPTHALIITHNGNATGKEINDYVKAMQLDVKQSFQIELEPEINII